MTNPSLVRAWPSLADLPALYPDARNRPNRGPFLYRAGKSWPLWTQPDTADRIPLLAVGSNGYPRQLQDKLSGTPADLQGVPTIPTILRDFDVAYCPIRSRKGYIPVTLAARPGAICLTWLQWLTPEQLNIISATEGSRYALVGSQALGENLRIQPPLLRPRTVYAWWFDSLLQRSGMTVWHNAYSRQLMTDIDRSEVQQNPIPAAWRQVVREPGSLAIEQESMSGL